MNFFRAMFITDLDGTLTCRKGQISRAVKCAIDSLGERQVLRVIATGRSLKGVAKILPPNFPIDYVVFSSGAGIYDWRTRELLHSVSMESAEIIRTRNILHELGLDYMIQQPIPENHFFSYFIHGEAGPDFARRCLKLKEFATQITKDHEIPSASQFLIIDSKGEGAKLAETLAGKLAPLSLIRATSPLDGTSTWLEIFPADVNKAVACEWLAQREGLSASDALAVGNDYNDVELLRWAVERYVVANCPPELSREFPGVVSSDDDGVIEAIRKWSRFTHG